MWCTSNRNSYRARFKISCRSCRVYETIKGILEYAEVSDCRMEQGSIRCDANISIRPVGQEEYGTKVEIKNINSFREVQKALEREEKKTKRIISIR